MSNFQLKILTHNEKIYENKVVSATVTCKNGQLTVLANHAPMVALLEEGSLIIRTEDDVLTGIAGSGILHVDRNETAAMLHGFSWADEEEEAPAQDSTDAKEIL